LIAHNFEEAMSEYLYALINPAMPGLVKVGKTTRDPADRVNELSSVTSVPTRFILVHTEVVNDCTAAEEWVHAQLELNNYRVSQNREFFSAPLHVVIDFIRASKAVGNSNGDSIAVSATNSINAANLIEELVERAEELIQGSFETFSNPKDGEKLLKQAAELGSVEAHEQLGSIYRYGAQGIKIDHQNAISHLKIAMEAGKWSTGATIGLIFLEHGKVLAGNAYLKDFFENCYGRLIQPKCDNLNGMELNGIHLLLVIGHSALIQYFYVKSLTQSMREIGINLVSEIGLMPHVIVPFVDHALKELGLDVRSGKASAKNSEIYASLKNLQSEVGSWDSSPAVLVREEILNTYPIGSIVKATVTKRSCSWVQVSIEGIPAIINGCDIDLEQPEDSRSILSIGDEIEVVLTKRRIQDFQFWASRKAALQRAPQ
jgi:hypothetical protein